MSQRKRPITEHDSKFRDTRCYGSGRRVHIRNRKPRNGSALPRGSMALFAKAKTVVGLDIGSSAVKAVELKPVGKGYKVTAFGAEPVPADAIVDGAISDAASAADALRRGCAGKTGCMSEAA